MNLSRRFVYSLAGVRHYPELAEDGLRKAMGYLLILVLVLVGARGIRQYREIDFVLSRLAQTITTWPDFRLSNGRLFFAGEMPYTVTDSDLTVIIDTSGRIGPDALELYQGVSSCLFTGTHFYLRDHGRSTAGGRWADLPFQTSRDALARLLPGLFWPILALAVIWSLIASVAAKAMFVVVLALAGWLVTGAGNLRLGRAATVAIYALTGPILLAIMKELCVTWDLASGWFFTRLFVDYFGLLYWGLAAVWTALAALAVKKALCAPPPVLATEERKEIELI